MQPRLSLLVFSKFLYDAASAGQWQRNRSRPSQNRIRSCENPWQPRFPQTPGRQGKVTTVPVHSRETLGPGLLRSILRDIELSVEDLVKNL
jgi:hypothetical protein